LPIFFFVFWVILNARITIEVIITGIIVAFLISLLFYRFIGLSPKTELKALRKIGAIIIFLGAVFWEVIKANFQMVKLLLSPKIKTDPLIKYFDSPVRSDLAKMAMACTINLTPGTVLIELSGNRFGVHTINAKFLDGMEDTWHIVKMLQKIEGGHDN
jgi:multicomponent Na+:H+ antiporter subunit E